MQPSDRKGTIAEASGACVNFRRWAAGEYVADCHKSLWSAIDDRWDWQTPFPIVHEPLAKRFIFIDPDRRGEAAGE